MKLVRRWSNGLLVLAAWLMPENKTEWVKAMKCEAEIVGYSLSWSLGCVNAAFQERVVSDLNLKKLQFSKPFLWLEFIIFFGFLFFYAVGNLNWLISRLDLWMARPETFEPTPVWFFTSSAIGLIIPIAALIHLITTRFCFKPFLLEIIFLWLLISGLVGLIFQWGELNHAGHSSLLAYIIFIFVLPIVGVLHLWFLNLQRMHDLAEA